MRLPLDVGVARFLLQPLNWNWFTVNGCSSFFFASCGDYTSTTAQSNIFPEAGQVKGIPGAS